MPRPGAALPRQSGGWSSPAPRRLHTGRAVGHATRTDVFRSKFTGHMTNAGWEDPARSESGNRHGGASRRPQGRQGSTGGGGCSQSTFHVPRAPLSGAHTTPPRPSPRGHGLHLPGPLGRPTHRKLPKVPQEPWQLRGHVGMRQPSGQSTAPAAVPPREGAGRGVCGTSQKASQT